MSEQPSTSEKNSGKYRPMEAIRDFKDRWPRLMALIYCHFFLLLLLSVSFVMGYVISSMEAPKEISENDSVMRNLYMTDMLPVRSTRKNLVELASSCLLNYEQNKSRDYTAEPQDLNHTSPPTTVNSTTTTNNNSNNSTETFFSGESDNIHLNGTDSVTDAEIANIDVITAWQKSLIANWAWSEFANFSNITVDFTDLTIPSPYFSSLEKTSEETANITDANESGISLSEEVLHYGQICTGIAEDLTISLVNFAVSMMKAREKNIESISFNWIRCWNESEHGSANHFAPLNEAERTSSLFVNQARYFADEWDKNRATLFDSYVAEFGCNETSQILDPFGELEIGSRNPCYWEAMKESVSNATGGKGCMVNTASASWFWFTVMTSAYELPAAV